MKLTAQRALAVMTTAVMGVKKFMCKEAGGPTDLCPMVHMIFEDGSHEIAMLLTDREAVPDLVRTYGQHGQIAFVAMVADGYHRSVPADVARHMERGEVAGAFAAGDMTVNEVLTVTMLDVSSDTMHDAMIRYTFRDDGTPKFGKPELLVQSGDAYIAGRVPELLREAVRA